MIKHLPLGEAWWGIRLLGFGFFLVLSLEVLHCLDESVDTLESLGIVARSTETTN